MTNTTKGKEKKSNHHSGLQAVGCFYTAKSCKQLFAQWNAARSPVASRRGSAGAGDMPAPSLGEVSSEVLLARATYHGTAGDEQQPPTLGMGLSASHGHGAVMRARGWRGDTSAVPGTRGMLRQEPPAAVSAAHCAPAHFRGRSGRRRRSSSFVPSGIS